MSLVIIIASYMLPTKKYRDKCLNYCSKIPLCDITFIFKLHRYICRYSFSVTYGNPSRRCRSDSPPCRRNVSRAVYKLFPLHNACDHLDNKRSSSRPKDPDNRSHRRKSSVTEPSTEAFGHILLTSAPISVHRTI